MIPSRRNFVAKLSLAFAALALPSFGWAIGKKKKKKKKKAAAAAGGDSKMGLIDVKAKGDSNVTTLLAVGYVANAKDYKSNTANKEYKPMEKGGVAHEKQGCKNCILGAADGKNWKCNLVPSAKFYVHADGWCQSWNPKG